MKRFILLAIAATISTAAIAAPETYVIDSNHSMPRFSYSHFGYSTQLSRFDKATGKIVIDRAAKTGSVDVTIDTTSVNTGFALFNEHIQAEDLFNTAKFPTATFVSKKMNFEGDKPVSIDGTLTIKGVSKAETLTVTSFMCMPHPMLKKDACGANATVVIKRSDFNMAKHVPYVSDEVTITLPVEAVKQ
ncbi:YceI family protein [Methylotenera sp.]|uniref:YceI family protein n=1 Tax=Methylotenera sp. TaxID=2051956 RepID=UPI0024884D4C|nr:YceI family protein [Methylotenera sp.]MDI1298101.1 YceI family protein [Methylotenera sp.]